MVKGVTIDYLQPDHILDDLHVRTFDETGEESIVECQFRKLRSCKACSFRGPMLR